MVEEDGFEPPVPVARSEAASSCQFRFSVSAARRGLNRTGERLASDSDQSDVYVCPAKERACMKRNPSRSGTRSLADELAAVHQGKMENG